MIVAFDDQDRTLADPILMSVSVSALRWWAFTLTAAPGTILAGIGGTADSQRHQSQSDSMAAGDLGNSCSCANLL